ncbi:MAG: cytidine deaminase [Kiritimatiellae bacterium]|nr:cytidine deaminase [Kiritimatiellia bacterium]
MQQYDPVALLEAACSVAELAHCPYSGFRVGAAVATRSGRIFSGCNVENASYGLTICAERVALTKAISEGHPTFVAIAVVASGVSIPYPCGACRQVLQEFCDSELPIHLSTLDAPDVVERHTLADLLPHPFVFEKP